MLNVDVHYADLALPIRKGLASRHALLTLKDAALAANHQNARSLSRAVNGALATLTVPIDSPDDVPLDTYVATRLAALPELATVHAKTGVNCFTCTGKQIACDGTNDRIHLEARGDCVAPIKECAALAVRATQKLYAFGGAAGMSHHVVVRFDVAKCCPSNAVYCLSGRSTYRDAPSRQVTEVTIVLGLEHWELNSYAALAFILAHELMCHAAHAMRQHAPRKNTSPHDRYVEGWMDFVARSALLAELGESHGKQLLSPDTPMTEAQAQRVGGVIASWRTADEWRGSCQDKRGDAVAPHRRFGEKLASEAKAIFHGLGKPEVFLQFSAAFNATATTKAERDSWLEDLDVVGSMIGGRLKHRTTRALERYAETGDIDEFRRVWRNKVAP